jgi:hypothetical protein
MDLGKAFSYVFDDPDWVKKVLLGGVITLVPILNFAASGYSLEVTRRVINNDPHPLPEWDDIGGKLVKGLLYTVISFVYALPILLLACLMQVGIMALGGAASSSSRSSSDALGGTAAIVSICFGCLILLYSVFMGVVLPAAIGNYAAKDQLGAAFRFGEVFALVQKNIGAYLMVLVIGVVAGLAAGLVGSVACGVGVFFTAFWALLVNGHATGQAYREASANIGLV